MRRTPDSTCIQHEGAGFYLLASDRCFFKTLPAATRELQRRVGEERALRRGNAEAPNHLPRPRVGARAPMKAARRNKPTTREPVTTLERFASARACGEKLYFWARERKVQGAKARGPQKGKGEETPPHEPRRRPTRPRCRRRRASSETCAAGRRPRPLRPPTWPTSSRPPVKQTTTKNEQCSNTYAWKRNSHARAGQSMLRALIKTHAGFQSARY
jgi:hypothetical protein